MDHYVQILKKSPIFSGFSEEIIKEEILLRSRAEDIPKGNYLIRAQEKCDSFGIILQGRVNISHIYESGGYGTMAILESADTFGVDLICTKNRISPYYASATQRTQMLSFPAAMVFEQGTLREELRLEILQKMLAFVADENMRKEYRLAILFQKGLRDRIMTFLTMQANKRHTNTFTVPFTREEMASYLCVNRTCLSNELGRMEKEGILRFSKNSFTLLTWNPRKEDY